MFNKFVLSFIAILVFSFAAFSQETKEEPKKEMAASKAAVKTMKGYVVDASCAKDMADKPDVMQKAANHTKECALKEMCAESGYGLFSEGKWYKFDDAGDKQAKSLIESTTKTKEISVVVKGTPGDGTLAVTSIKEQKAMKAMKKGRKAKS
ncbi:MAG: hypothetical protein ACHQQQ_07245 [Bacteroidota bacterium]